MAGLDIDGLPRVAQAQEQAKARLAAQEERLREQQDVQHDRADDHLGDDDRAARSIDQKRTAMEARQRERRLEFVQAEQQVLTRHQDEKLALDAAQKAESGGLLFRMRARVADLISERPALRSVLGHITEKAGLDPRDRHRLEQQALARRHARERVALAGRKRAMEKIEKRERASLERDFKREMLQRMVQQEQLRAAAKVEGLDTREAAEILRTDPRLLEERAFQDEFNHEAVGEDHYDDDGHGGDDDDGHKKKRSWKQRAKDKGLKQGRGRGGFGYRRGD